MKRTVISTSFEETQKLGEEIGHTLKAGSIVALFGDLGSGKTTLTQGIAKGLGLRQTVISPTFMLIREYTLGDKTLYHIDLYRLEKETDLSHIGLSDIFSDKNGIVIIEWAEKIEKLLPERTLRITLENKSGEEREITIHDR